MEEGSTLHLEVDVEGCPQPTVKWLRNGREVSADARIKISRDTQRQETYNLAVNLIKYEEQGEYEVIVTNSLGTVSSKSYVTVHSKYIYLPYNKLPTDFVSMNLRSYVICLCSRNLHVQKKSCKPLFSLTLYRGNTH